MEKVSNYFLFNAFNGLFKGSEVQHKAIFRIVPVRVIAENKGFEFIINFFLGGAHIARYPKW